MKREDPALAVYRELRKATRRWERIAEKHTRAEGFKGDDHPEVRAAYSPVEALGEKLAKTPAATAAGILAKLKLADVLAGGYSEGSLDRRLIESAKRDLRRMAKKGGPK
ncbi:MAG: hypothetical protein WAN51_04990 [Alphaproteobacteria bacterium]